MGIAKLLKCLHKQLKRSHADKIKQCDQLEELLNQLQKKEQALQQKLQKAKNISKRKRLKTDLKIVKLQLKKGRKRLDELNKNH